jgi:leader peptidase (prepilin peptidase)/N-methyltransferase
VAAAAAIAFLGGLIAGSFITVVAHRVPRGESIVGPRSRCPQCGTTISARDNVPVLSWLLLRGRARCCGASISVRYPLTELGLGAAYVAVVLVL